VLEAKLDRGRGAVATFWSAGHAKDSRAIHCGQIFGKVRAMFNDKGEAIIEAGRQRR
jgi:translation initiation factor IF-2